MSSKGIHVVHTTTLILLILRHALHDPGFGRYRNRWMLQGTLTALLNEYYDIPESLHFTEDDVGHALGGRNQLLLMQHGFGTLNSPFQYNTCGVYKSDYHNVRGMIRKRAFYLEDRMLNHPNAPKVLRRSQRLLESPRKVVRRSVTTKLISPPKVV